MKNTIIAAAALLFTSGLAAQSTATGYVFEDSNQNGRKDRREKGISQVAVTNGQEVVLTHASGE